MEQLAQPIRQFLAMPALFKTKNVNGPAVRMSEINRSHSDASNKTSESFNLTENFKNISQQMAKLAESVNEQAIIQSKEELNQELNDLDFKQFVADLSLSMDQIPVTIPVGNLQGSQKRHPANRIIYERTVEKETIIIDSIPHRDSDDIQVVKVKITLPKENGKVSVQPITNCTSTFKRSKMSAMRAARVPRRHENGHHLPIMGKAALLSKHRNSENFKNNQDSEIVRELVTQRFQNTLLNYYEKSFHRQNSRNHENYDKYEKCENHEESHNFEVEENPQPPQALGSTFTDDLHGISSIASESMLSISTKTPIDIRSSGNYSFRASTACSSRLQSMGSLNTATVDQISEDSYRFSSVGCLVDDMQFLLSTDAMNCETTNEVNVNHTESVQQSPVSRTSTTNSIFDGNQTVEYDATQFLKDALGDELNNYYSTDASYMNSIGTSNISALVSRAETHEYNTTIFEDSVQPSEYEYYPFNNRITELLAESNVQYQAILQTSKALSFCRSTKEFSCGEEELEAERILLIATCKRDAIREEIHRLEYEEIHLDTNTHNTGSIKINQIVLPPKQRASIYASRIFEKKKKTKYSDWYLCVLSCGTTVYATTAVQADSDGFVRFRNEIIFSDLSPDFEIKIALYCMRVGPQKSNMSHETKYHLDNNTTLCPLSPTRIKTNKQYKNITIQNYINEKSSYVLCGQFTMKINNITNLGHFKLSQLNLPLLEGNFIMDFASNVNLQETYSGFLDVAVENRGMLAWNRRWCTLCEGLLKYYNYPGEEIPLGFIDLHYCATATVSSADRQICARPRTLLVEIFTHFDDAKSQHIVKYFLAADSKQYMEMWCNKLNSTVNALRTWNAMKQQSSQS